MLDLVRDLARRHRRAFTLIELSVVVAICGTIASMAVTRYEKSVCLAQEREALITLRNIADVEETVLAEHGHFDCTVPLCTFVGYDNIECVGKENLISISFKGRSRFSYEVECVGDTQHFRAHARGTSGQVLGGHLTTNQERVLDRAGSVCR